MTSAELRVHHGEILMKFGEQLHVFHGIPQGSDRWQALYLALQVAIKGAMEIHQLREDTKGTS